MDDITIRKARPEDSAQIANMAQALAKHEGGQGLSSESSVRADAFGDAAKCHFIVAEKPRGELLGMAMFYAGYDLESASGGLHLGDVFVRPKHRRVGVGRALLCHVAQEVAAQGGQWLSWTVARENKAAAKFYQSLGAQQVPVKFMAMGKKAILNLDS